jgi:hypothetical protein
MEDYQAILEGNLDHFKVWDLYGKVHAKKNLEFAEAVYGIERSLVYNKDESFKDKDFADVFKKYCGG